MNVERSINMNTNFLITDYADFFDLIIHHEKKW